MTTHTVQRRFAFTLIELMLSAGIVSILVGGLVSAVVVAGRALPDAQNVSTVTGVGATALDQMAGELYGAINFTVRGANTVEFTVADRNGDSAPETIRYQWSGIAGDPVYRTYNGGTPVAVCNDVRSFALAYSVKTVITSKTTTASVDSGEVLLASFSGWAGVIPTVTGYLLTQSSWAVEYTPIQLTLPSGVSELSFTKLRLKLKDSSVAGETLEATLYPPAVAGKPEPATASAYGTASLNDSGLTSSYAWADFNFSGVKINKPVTEIVFGVRSTAALLNGVRVQYYNSTSAPSDAQTMLWTTNNGGAWQPSSNRQQNDIVFELYGSYRTDATVTTDTYRYFITGVSAALSASADSGAAILSSTPVLNMPETASP